MLKKIFAVASIVVLSVGELAAQEKYVVDKVVAVVGSSAILYSDVVETSNVLVEDRKKQGYTSDRDPVNEALETLMLQKLLYNQALVDSVMIYAEGVSSSVESRLNYMIEEAGSIAELEKRNGRPVFEIRQDIRQAQEEMQYAQMMRMEVVSKVKITPGEVERYYNKLNKDSLPIIPEQYEYAQITRYPRSSSQAKQRVRERLLDMRERVINGERFDLLARMYSVDTGSAMNGGEMDFMPLDAFLKPFADALAKLQPGQISEAVETEYGFHIIQLIEKKGNLYKARHIVLRPVYTTEELLETDRFLDSVAMQIKSGGITFGDAAVKYSDDKYSKQNGGLVTNHEIMEYYGANDTSYSTTKFLREELQADYNYIRNLKPGEMSPVYRSQDLRGNELSKMIKLVGVIPSHPANLKDDYLRLEEMALQVKQADEFEKWLDKKIEGMYVRVEPEYRDGDFVNKHWLK